MTNAEIIAKLAPCSTGLAAAKESATIREWWDTSTSRSDMMWLVGRAHVGTLTRRQLVLVAVRCAEANAHMMADDSLPHLATISSWANGADDITADDIKEARTALWSAAYAAAHAYADAAYAAAHAYAAVCDVIRDAITIDSVCVALGLDPDQGVV